MALHKVVLLGQGDPRQGSTWSGTPAHLLRALEDHHLQVGTVPLRPRVALPLRVLARAKSAFGMNRYAWDREPIYLRHMGGQALSFVQSQKPDFALFFSSLPVSYLGATQCPVVLWVDATVPKMLDYNPSFTNWSERSRRVAARAEARAFDRADLVVTASQWAADSVVEDYGASRDKVRVLPFGANLDEPVPATAARRTLPARGEPLKLLLVGVDWHNKGADIAAEAAEALAARGMRIELHIVGCMPPAGTALSDAVICHGFLSKAKPSEALRLRSLYRDSHIFVLPSKAEAMGIAVAEAAAYGLPAIARRTGGMATVVRDGRTGYLPVDPTPEAIASLIEKLANSPELYNSFSSAARALYVTELNWRTAVDGLLDHVSRLKGADRA